MFGVSQIIHIFDSLVDSLGQVGPVGPKISRGTYPIFIERALDVPDGTCVVYVSN